MMKKKLFVLALLVSLYSVFTIAFTTFDNQGKIETFIADMGLLDSDRLSHEDKASLKTPMPKPSDKPTSPKKPPRVI